jgi:hypothetical protein
MADSELVSLNSLKKKKKKECKMKPGQGFVFVCEIVLKPNQLTVVV